MKEQEIVGEGKKKGSVHKMWRMSGILFEFPTKAERVAAGGLRVVSRAHVPRSVSRRVFAWKGRQGAAPTGGGWGGWRQRWQAATGEVCREVPPGPSPPGTGGGAAPAAPGASLGPCHPGPLGPERSSYSLKRFAQVAAGLGCAGLAGSCVKLDCTGLMMGGK